MYHSALATHGIPSHAHRLCVELAFVSESHARAEFDMMHCQGMAPPTATATATAMPFGLRGVCVPPPTEQELLATAERVYGSIEGKLRQKLTADGK